MALSAAPELGLAAKSIAAAKTSLTTRVNRACNRAFIAVILLSELPIPSLQLHAFAAMTAYGKPAWFPGA
ncbi:MAG: hypothetical protein IH604_08085 [Burkholderiales bacterium]|nr:hypothetical protein [Burkholderiales bacterium]